jgi:hypothetical protein
MNGYGFLIRWSDFLSKEFFLVKDYGTFQEVNMTILTITVPSFLALSFSSSFTLFLWGRGER